MCMSIQQTAAAGAARAGVQYQTLESRGSRRMGPSESFLTLESPHTSSSRRLGSSTISLMRFRKVTASRPSISLRAVVGAGAAGDRRLERVRSGSAEVRTAVDAWQRGHTVLRVCNHASQAQQKLPPRQPLTCGHM